MVEINFLASSNHLLPGIKDSSKTNIPSSIQWWPSYWSLTKQNYIWSKALIRPLIIRNCVLSFK